LHGFFRRHGRARCVSWTTAHTLPRFRSQEGESTAMTRSHRTLYALMAMLASAVVILSSLFAGPRVLPLGPQSPPTAANLCAELRVPDSATGRGVPLAELGTVNGLKFVTDNAGRVAFHERGLMDREVFFAVRSHGYEAPKDGFGFAGARLTPRTGK